MGIFAQCHVVDRSYAWPPQDKKGDKSRVMSVLFSFAWDVDMLLSYFYFFFLCLYAFFILDFDSHYIHVSYVWSML